MRIRSSIKFTLSALAVVAVLYGGWVAFNEASVSRYVIKPVKPGEVNIVAVQPGGGYGIIVANQTAQLAEYSDSAFGTGNRNDESGEVQTAKKLPVRDLLGSLQGDQKSLNYLVQTLNDLSEANLPPVRVIWTAEDIRKALDGDSALLKKLQADLQVDLEGNPFDPLDYDALQRGIVIDNPVPVTVSIAGQKKILTARVQEAYVAQFSVAMEAHTDKAFVSPEQLRGFFVEEKEKLKHEPALKEKVRKSLEARIDPQRVERFRDKPEKVLSNSVIVLTDEHMKGASIEQYEGSDGKPIFDVNIQLTEEGRMRLWSYSHRNRGFQLLLISNGVAVAAPRIKTELSQSSVRITQLTSESLAKDTVDRVKKVSKK